MSISDRFIPRREAIRSSIYAPKFSNLPLASELFPPYLSQTSCVVNIFFYKINLSYCSALAKFVNKAADGGITALHMAALNGYFDCVQLLLDIYANVSAVTFHYGTSMDLIGMLFVYTEQVLFSIIFCISFSFPSFFFITDDFSDLNYYQYINIHLFLL